ncbi:MAG: hypothetical protein AB8B56_05010 [Crocinitomicaceae bacterium]
MRLTISLLALSIIAVSCKKEDPPQADCEPVVIQNNNIDTIFPSDYIMAYPGSWWVYDDGFIDNCTSWEAVPIRTKNTYNGCIYIHEDMWILPKGNIFNNLTAFDKAILNYPDSNSTRKIPIFDTLVGTFYDSLIEGGSGEHAYTQNWTGETLDRIDSMTIGVNTYYDVIHVRTIVDWNYDLQSDATYIVDRWFSKGVGMIKWIRSLNGWISTDVELVDHYIAPY